MRFWGVLAINSIYYGEILRGRGDGNIGLGSKRAADLFWKKNMKLEILYFKSITTCVLEK